jgi:hypothetical protein
MGLNHLYQSGLLLPGDCGFLLAWIALRRLVFVSAGHSDADYCLPRLLHHNAAHRLAAASPAASPSTE